MFKGKIKEKKEKNSFILLDGLFTESRGQSISEEPHLRHTHKQTRSGDLQDKLRSLAVDSRRQPFVTAFRRLQTVYHLILWNGEWREDCVRFSRPIDQ